MRSQAEPQSLGTSKYIRLWVIVSSSKAVFQSIIVVARRVKSFGCRSPYNAIGGKVVVAAVTSAVNEV